MSLFFLLLNISRESNHVESDIQKSEQCGAFLNIDRQDVGQSERRRGGVSAQDMHERNPSIPVGAAKFSKSLLIFRRDFFILNPYSLESNPEVSARKRKGDKDVADSERRRGRRREQDVLDCSLSIPVGAVVD